MATPGELDNYFVNNVTPVEATAFNAWGAGVKAAWLGAQGYAAAAAASAASAAAPADDTVAALVASPASATTAQLAAKYAPHVTPATQRAVAFSKLPDWANGEYSYNGVPFIQDNLTTVGDQQYAVWWNAAKAPMIVKRTLPEGPWSVPFDLSTVAANPLVAPVGADAHNSIVLGVDSLGYIHVSGNMHGQPLRYMRSTSPGNITAWAAAAMVGTNETSVTYPNFVSLPDSTLLFFYRNGTSGSGDLYANRYSTTTGTWTRVGKMIDGLASSESPYWNRLAVDPAGAVHVFFCWRGTGTADTNNDFGYVKFSNLTGTAVATKANGAAQTLPVTHANSETIIDTAATGSGMVNTHGADVDTAGRPHSVTWLYDGAGKTQLEHVWHDGAAWHVDQVTDLTQRIDLVTPALDPSLSRAQVACTPGGETLIVFRCNYDGRRGTVRAIDVTPGTPRVEFPIARLDLYNWEPCLDSRALRDRGELHMLIVPLTSDGATASGVGVDCWSTQLAGVLTVDLAQIALVRAGGAALPTRRYVTGRTGPNGGIAVSATTAASLLHGTVMVPQGAGQVFFARSQTRSKGLAAGVVITTQIATQREVPAPTVTSTLGTTSVTGTANGFKATPWIPLTTFGVTDDDRGWVYLFAFKAGAANGEVSVATLEVSVLEYM